METDFLSDSLSVFCLDVDGVLTDGSFTYGELGKIQKVFGPDDADALRLLSKFMRIEFVSADRRGFSISQKRIVDMGFELRLMSSEERRRWMDAEFGLERVAYMGDSFMDATLLQKVKIGIAPANSHELAKKSADFVTSHRGGDRAVAEACFYLAKLLSLDLLDGK